MCVASCQHQCISCSSCLALPSSHEGTLLSLPARLQCCAGIVHRDLKLENMILQNERDDSPVKIADFGLSKFFSPETVLSTMCGSPQYGEWHKLIIYYFGISIQSSRRIKERDMLYMEFQSSARRPEVVRQEACRSVLVRSPRMSSHTRMHLCLLSCFCPGSVLEACHLSSRTTVLNAHVKTFASRSCSCSCP